MAVNESYYGLAENWLEPTSINQANVPRDEKWLVANFLNNTDSPEERTASRLSNAIYRALADNSSYYDPNFYEILFGEVLDKSIVFMGMAGEKCPYTTINYYSNRKEAGETEWNIVNEGSNIITDVVNYSFGFTNFNYTNQMGNNSRGYRMWLDRNHSSSTYDSTYSRWTPEPINHGTKNNSYFEYYLPNTGARNQLTPITQIPVRRTVWVPYILAGTITTSEDVESISSVGLYDLDTYINTYKETKTAVLSISMAPWVCLTTSDEPTVSNPRVTGRPPSLISHEYLNFLDSYYVPAWNMNTGIKIDDEHPLNFPCIPLSPYLLLGGPLGYALNNTGNGTSIQTNHQTFEIVFYPTINCGIITFDNWLNNGKLVSSSSGTNPVYADADQYTDDEFREAVRNAVACFGMFFTDSVSDAQTKQLDDTGMFLGILENGVGYGNYTEGEENRNQPQFNWKTMDENEYDPDNPPTPVLPDNWSDTTDSPYAVSGYPLPNHWYIANSWALVKVFNAINDVDLETLDKSLTFGLNPIDGVLLIKHVYLNMAKALDRLQAQLSSYLDIGELQLLIELIGQEKLYSTNINWIYTFDVVTSYPVGEPTPYNDFRSYMPYSSAAFYDAFCGIVEIDPAKILNKYISIRQTVDFLSGDKITSLYASEDGSDLGERIAVLTGNCSHDLPINGSQTADYARNKYMLQKGIESTRWERVSRIAMGLAGASISAMTENVIGAAAQTIGTLANSKMLETQEETQRYLLQHTVPSVSKIQNGTSNVEAGVISGPTLFMYLPRMDENYDVTDYRYLTGFSGYRVVKPSDLSLGTHVFANPKISISGTKNEAIMLADQLKKGIIIK